MALNEMTPKSRVEDLAAFGGTPAFELPLHVGRPNIGDREALKRRLDDILDTKWLSGGGRYVREFENQVAELAGVKHCVAMCNATVALGIAIRALGLKGEVILPSFTFIATAHALQWLDIKPVFCDIDPETHNIDPRKVEQLISPETTGILGVHIWGRACDVDALSLIAKKRGLRLLYDSAHALNCSIRKQMIGGFGNAEVFSFHATKFINSFEGGAVTTNDEELADRIRLMRNFGFSHYDRTDCIGTNGKMNEMSAAMGLTNLESLTDFTDVNCHNYRQYRRELSGLEGVTVVAFDEEEKNNYQYVVLEIDDDKTIVTRDQLVEILHAENVLVRRYFYPGCHRMEPYRSLFPLAEGALPHTERLAGRVLCLPTGTSIGKNELDTICEIIRFMVQNGKQIKSRIGRRTKG